GSHPFDGKRPPGDRGTTEFFEIKAQARAELPTIQIDVDSGILKLESLLNTGPDEIIPPLFLINPMGLYVHHRGSAAGLLVRIKVAYNDNSDLTTDRTTWEEHILLPGVTKMIELTEESIAQLNDYITMRSEQLRHPDRNGQYREMLLQHVLNLETKQT